MTTRAGRPVELRHTLRDADRRAIAALVEATGMFSAAEVEIAAELVDERLERGADCDYRFAVAEIEERVVGYACFGPIPCTVSSYDVYWIAVDPTEQGRGVGRRLLADVEKRVVDLGGTRIYVDTSGRDAYAPTRAFYERMGYKRAAALTDFYAPGDAKIVYVKPV